jgi:hypothetical protein
MAFNPRHLYRMAIGDGGDFVNQHRELTFWLGAISVQWAGLEAATFHLFFQCLGIDIVRAQVAFYSHRNGRARRQLALDTFVETHKAEEAHKALEEIMRKIGKLADRRNDLIHHAWATDAQGKRPHRFGIDIRENPSPEHENQLKDLFERIDSVTRELTEFQKQHFNHPEIAIAKKESAKP